MKKNLPLVLLLSMIYLSETAFSQSEAFGDEKVKRNKAAQTYLDPVLNLVTTNFNYGKSNTALSDYKKSVLGAQVGMTFQAGISSRFSLVSELYFMMKGGRLQADNLLNGDKTILRFYTLESPLLARFHFGKFYVNAGPSIAYTIYGTRNMEGSASRVSFNTADGFKHWDASVQTGAGYRFKVKQKNASLDIRYTYGLTNIAHSGEMYNRYLTISLHFSNPWKSNPLGREKKS